MRIHTLRALLPIIALLVAGCATTLEPAPGANRVEGRGEGAIAANNGVRVIARAEAWRGVPRELNGQLTPMLVTVVNDSAMPIRISYNKFRMVSESGRRYSALPPFRIDGTVTTRVGNYYRPQRFWYAPYLSPYFPGVAVYNGPFLTNRLYWDRFAPVFATVSLPTDDMLEKALPEGVLAPGGRMTGFVYFEGVGPDARRVRLVADFPNATDKGVVARVMIPFDVGNV